MYDADRKSRLEAAIRAAEAAGNHSILLALRKALKDLVGAYREHPPYKDREL
ncbi:hypothetical protein S-CBP42_0027 [Synechococcus phage S-CBP42]|uniref:Uncharacterized protein n=1 Tax=Synechococcus phage S-CBP42 TaxID=461711 RepID=A0A096VKU7_9CAUD|nr:hypothetical protein AVU76_gp27 [Synechococcus phage S-CBP42]AGK86678.1 hypothetical protein S-CBP42_0027 [Synechococcus phage S-CBP42]